VLAVDDQPAVRDLLRLVVDATDQLVSVGEANSGEEAIELAGILRPDMILMDARMPGMGGITAATHIRSEWPRTVIVLISTTHPDELVPQIAPGVVDAVIWKNELESGQLDRVWSRAGDR
jgi:CheY-like chemotaxis protein